MPHGLTKINESSISFSRKLAISQHLTKVGCCLYLKAQRKLMNLLNGTPISSPSPLAERAMSWVCHFDAVTQYNNTNR